MEEGRQREIRHCCLFGSLPFSSSLSTAAVFQASTAFTQATDKVPHLLPGSLVSLHPQIIAGHGAASLEVTPVLSRLLKILPVSLCPLKRGTFNPLCSVALDTLPLKLQQLPRGAPRLPSASPRGSAPSSACGKFSVLRALSGLLFHLISLWFHPRHAHLPRPLCSVYTSIKTLIGSFYLSVTS